MERERLGSRLGFILLSAGCAIGIGNVWKFPYMTGLYGGGAFVLFYLFFLVILGVPVLTMEFSMGRASRKSPIKMYDKLAPKGSKWHIYSYFSMAGNYLLMMFYTTVSGWMINYFVSTATGKFVNASSEQINSLFGDILSSPSAQVGYMSVVVLFGFMVCAIGLQKGIERVSKFLMLALLVIMVGLAINSIMTDGGMEGLKFYLIPDFERLLDNGVFSVIVAAMNQAFFTLSIGMGSMAIFGSYIDKKQSLMGEAVNVALLDTFVAFTSGLIIFPACFAYGVQPNSGPDLIFKTLPNIFTNMNGGRLWGSLFFIFMTFAAFSTVIAVFENIISCCYDLFGWNRKKACVINAVLLFVLSLPCALGFNLLSSIQPLGAGTTFMDLEDFLVSNLLLPIGSLIYIMFCVSRYGWGWDNFKAEANTGKGIKIAQWMRPYMTYVLPLTVLVVFVVGLIDFFKK